MTHRPKFYGVGVGPGDPRLLTLRAIEVLQSVDVIAIPKSRLERESIAWEIARKHCAAKTRLLELELPMTSDHDRLAKAWQEGADKILGEIKSGHTVAFVTLGDPSLYSTYSYLLQYLSCSLPPEEIETIPGITAMSAAAAKVNTPLAVGDEPLVVLPSTEGVKDYLDMPNLVLMKISRGWPQILETLRANDKSSILLIRVGQPGEKIQWYPERSTTYQESLDYLSLMLVKNKPHPGEK